MQVQCNSKQILRQAWEKRGEKLWLPVETHQRALAGEKKGIQDAKHQELSPRSKGGASAVRTKKTSEETTNVRESPSRTCIKRLSREMKPTPPFGWLKSQEGLREDIRVRSSLNLNGIGPKNRKSQKENRSKKCLLFKEGAGMSEDGKRGSAQKKRP